MTKKNVNINKAIDGEVIASLPLTRALIAAVKETDAVKDLPKRFSTLQPGWPTSNLDNPGWSIHETTGKSFTDAAAMRFATIPALNTVLVNDHWFAAPTHATNSIFSDNKYMAYYLIANGVSACDAGAFLSRLANGTCRWFEFGNRSPLSQILLKNTAETSPFPGLTLSGLSQVVSEALATETGVQGVDVAAGSPYCNLAVMCVVRLLEHLKVPILIDRSNYSVTYAATMFTSIDDIRNSIRISEISAALDGFTPAKVTAHLKLNTPEALSRMRGTVTEALLRQVFAGYGTALLHVRHKDDVLLEAGIRLAVVYLLPDTMDVSLPIEYAKANAATLASDILSLEPLRTHVLRRSEAIRADMTRAASAVRWPHQSANYTSVDAFMNDLKQLISGLYQQSTMFMPVQPKTLLSCLEIQRFASDSICGTASASIRRITAKSKASRIVFRSHGGVDDGKLASINEAPAYGQLAPRSVSDWMDPLGGADVMLSAYTSATTQVTMANNGFITPNGARDYVGVLQTLVNLWLPTDKNDLSSNWGKSNDSAMYLHYAAQAVSEQKLALDCIGSGVGEDSSLSPEAAAEFYDPCSYILRSTGFRYVVASRDSECRFGKPNPMNIATTDAVTALIMSGYSGKATLTLPTKPFTSENKVTLIPPRYTLANADSSRFGDDILLYLDDAPKSLRDKLPAKYLFECAEAADFYRAFVVADHVDSEAWFSALDILRYQMDALDGDDRMHAIIGDRLLSASANSVLVSSSDAIARAMAEARAKSPEAVLPAIVTSLSSAAIFSAAISTTLGYGVNVVLRKWNYRVLSSLMVCGSQSHLVELVSEALRARSDSLASNHGDRGLIQPA